MTEIALETKLINKFVVENKRERCIGFIQEHKHRSKFISEISRARTFDQHLFESINGNEVEIIKSVFEWLKLTDCYVISENKEIDGQRFSLQESLDKALSPWSDVGTLIVFGDADALYREHDGLKNKWISRYYWGRPPG